MGVRASIASSLHRLAERFGGARSTPRSAGSWDAGSINRLYDDWSAWTVSPEFETGYEFRLTRARARWMARNNPWIVGFLDELANNVVGANGIQLQARVKNRNDKLAKATNDEIERGWLEWSLPENASADGHDSLTELERQIIQTIAVDGECFVRRVFGADNPFGYTLQIIDADLVDETYNVAAGPKQNRIRMGIEIDKRNRPIAYHIWSRYAEDASGEEYKRERIAAEEILHLFVRWHRSNIPRGVTWFAPVITRLRHEGEYEINHLVASRAGASKMAFILNKQPAAIDAFVPPKPGAKPKMFEMEPGVIPELAPGQEIAEFDPTFPSIAYEQYTMAVLRAIARGLRVSYLTLTGDLRQANYSSMRAGEVPQRERWRGLQTWFSVHGIRIFYRDWVDMATLKRAIAVDSRLGSDYYDVVFHGRGWKPVDPKSDLDAAVIEIALGLNSRTRLNAERGQDYEQIVDELREETDYADEEGVDVSGAAAKSQPAAAPAQPGDGSPPSDGSDGTNNTRHLTAIS